MPYRFDIQVPDAMEEILGLSVLFKYISIVKDMIGGLNVVKRGKKVSIDC